MIRDVIAQAWAESPARVVGAVLAAPFMVAALWALLVVVIVAGSPS